MNEPRLAQLLSTLRSKAQGVQLSAAEYAAVRSRLTAHVLLLERYRLEALVCVEQREAKAAAILAKLNSLAAGQQAERDRLAKHYRLPQLADRRGTKRRRSSGQPQHVGCRAARRADCCRDSRVARQSRQQLLGSVLFSLQAGAGRRVPSTAVQNEM